MDVVYVTLDTPEQLPAWNQLLAKENISWRSLSVGGRLNEIREKYKVRAYSLFLSDISAEIENGKGRYS